MVVPDFAIVIVTLYLLVYVLAFLSDVTAADYSSLALNCTIIDTTNSILGDVCSR